MTNPKEVLNKLDKEFPELVVMSDKRTYRNVVDKEKSKEFLISTIINLLTSQLEAIPEDEEVMARAELWDRLSELADGDLWNRLTPKEWNLAHQLFENQERQRQRQDLQLAINKWSELSNNK